VSAAKSRHQPEERRRSALASLSAVGAAVAGAGVGALIGPKIIAIAWPAVLAGLVAHLVGMVGMRRLQSATGYRTPGWQTTAYWLCWAVIGVILLFGLWKLVR
jgi:hypothetical protein